MRIPQGYGDRSSLKQNCFTSLVQECQLSAPGYKLSESLKKKIEVFDKNDRKCVVDQTSSEFGCTPLFLACKNGSAHVVEYLLLECGADIEQRGIFQVLDEGVSHSVTPLWCAAVSGRLSVVKVLIAHGSNVNAASDSGSTPVRSACYIVRDGVTSAHFEIIRCLVSAGADIQIPNHFGGTCLINSIQSPSLTEYLIDNDVDVNAEDVQLKTALHYAVEENRLETAKLLLEKGADPMKKSKYGDDVLQTACLKGNVMMFNYLMENVSYEPSRIADAFELIGSTFLLDLHDLGSTLFFWKKALEIRYNGRFKKYPKNDIEIHEVHKVKEMNSLDEFESSISDLQGLRVQALIMSERILGKDHKDTVFRYMYGGAAHADANRYRQCVLLWNYALKLKISKDTLLAFDSSFTARAIVQLYVNILRKIFVIDGRNDLKLVRDACEVEFDDVLKTTKLICEGLSPAIALLHDKPVFKAQAENLDIVLTSWIHLVHILLKMAISHKEMQEVYAIVRDVVKLDPKTHNSGDTLLHLVVSSSSTLRSNSFLDEDSYPLFPSLEMTRFLLLSGYDVHCRNHLSETPLHIACKPNNFSINVIKMLLSYEGHLDSPNAYGILPLDLLKSHSKTLFEISHISLKCLAARVMSKYYLHDDNIVPIFLKSFVSLH